MICASYCSDIPEPGSKISKTCESCTGFFALNHGKTSRKKSHRTQFIVLYSPLDSDEDQDEKEKLGKNKR